jgi:hypothetical protein
VDADELLEREDDERAAKTDMCSCLSRRETETYCNYDESSEEPSSVNWKCVQRKEVLLH